MNNKKEFLNVTILVHPYKKLIVDGLESGKISFEDDTLRGIGKKIGLKQSSTAQIVKHHLEQLVGYGIIQKIYGNYVYYKKPRKKDYLDSIENEILSFIDATDNQMLIKGLREALLIVRRHKRK